MKGTFRFFVLLLISCCITLQAQVNILPKADFVANFCNFPQAWTVSKGAGVEIAVIDDSTNNKISWHSRIITLAPESKVSVYNVDQFLSDKIGNCQIILLIASPNEQNVSEFLLKIDSYSKNNITVIIPAFIGNLTNGFDYSFRKEFLKIASEKGAVIFGFHGRAFQIGDISFWHDIPVDLHALHFFIDGGYYFEIGAEFKKSVEEPAHIVAAAIAILKSKETGISNKILKNILKTRNRKLLWVELEFTRGERAGYRRYRVFLNEISLKNYLTEYQEYIPRIIQRYEGTSLDAALLLNLKPMDDGVWCRELLEISKAQKKSTGKNIVVAILDHLFDKNDPVFENKLFNPGSVVDSEDVFNGYGHGTSMTKDLVKIAPGVKIMPVRICTNNIQPDADQYIKGILYAVNNGADIISLSHKAIDPSKQQDFDEAVKYATSKNVTIVFINYKGELEEVVVSKPIEFASFDKRKNSIYVLGTNFINEQDFPYTWGVSQTAPIVAGVIALMKEIKKEITPIEIKDMLLKSSIIIDNGYKLLNAKKTLELLTSTLE